MQLNIKTRNIITLMCKCFVHVTCICSAATDLLNATVEPVLGGRRHSNNKIFFDRSGPYTTLFKKLILEKKILVGELEFN